MNQKFFFYPRYLLGSSEGVIIYLLSSITIIIKDYTFEYNAFI